MAIENKKVAIPSIQVCCLIRLWIPASIHCLPFKSQSLLFRSAVWFKSKIQWPIVSCKYVAIPSIQVCCLILPSAICHNSGVQRVAIPSIQVCCLILKIRLAIEPIALELVAIPSIQVCCLIQEFWQKQQQTKRLCRNPFYSGLLFDSRGFKRVWRRYNEVSQSLLFRSAVWFGATVFRSFISCQVAIPSIQVCCLIQMNCNIRKVGRIMSQSLLFRSAVWFTKMKKTTEEKIRY